jgi:D-ornithine/D-lysine decarboxylase
MSSAPGPGVRYSLFRPSPIYGLIGVMTFAPKSFLDIRDGRLRIDGLDAVRLADEHGTPLFVYVERQIRENIERFNAIREAIPCPLKICYAAKAMSTMGVLRVVRDAGVDIEVNSGGELWKALQAGFSGDQIIFNGTSKEVWELEMAINAGIYAIQVDSLYELWLIAETARRLGKRATVSLRLVPEIESGTHSGLQTALLTSKFGMMPDEALEAFRKHKDSPHLDLCGIHLHVGSQNPDPAVYTEALSELIATLDRVHRETGVKLNHINLGGGFPVDYLRGANVDLADDHHSMLAARYGPYAAIGSAFRDAAKHHQTSLDGVTLLLEPGRSIIADAGLCLTTVRNKKERPVSDSSLIPHPSSLPNDVWLLTDAGFNILLSMETYKWYYHLISASRAGEPHDTPYKVAGPLCDGGDVYFDIDGNGRLPEHRMLPADVGPGEILALLNCGAYSLAQASQYNGRFLPAVVLIKTNGKTTLIRRRETFDDLIDADL